MSLQPNKPSFHNHFSTIYSAVEIEAFLLVGSIVKVIILPNFFQIWMK